MQQAIYTNDLVNNKILVEREFAGTLEQVWRAWTESEILEKWWAPLPFKAVTKEMDFREGGHWWYHMLGPDGSKFWCWLDYLSISRLEKFTARNIFCDEEGKPNTELPDMHWENFFSSTGAGTKVKITVTFASKEDLEKIVSMGFQEGFRMAHENLDKLLMS